MTKALELQRRRGRSVRIESDAADTPRVIKRFAHPAPWSRIFDRTRAQREWSLLRALHAEGLPVPRPLTLARVPGGYEVALEYIANARTLAAELAAPRMPLDPLAPALGRALAKLHEFGLDHPDLHPGNLLVCPDGSVRMIDFHSARRRARLSSRTIWRDLVSLAASVREHTSRAWRLRFLRAWQRAAPAELTRAIAFDRVALVRLESLARTRRLEIVRKRAARFLEQGRAVRAIDGGGWAGFEVLDAPQDELRRRAAELGAAGQAPVELRRSSTGSEWIRRGARRTLLDAWKTSARLCEHAVPAFRPWLFVTRPRAALIVVGPPGARCWSEVDRRARVAELGALLGTLVDRGLWIATLDAHDVCDVAGRAHLAAPRGLSILDPRSDRARALPIIAGDMPNARGWRSLCRAAHAADRGGARATFDLVFGDG